MLASILIYLALGAVVGILAGLLGLGGGLVIVPMLLFAFSQAGFDPQIIMHLAIGSSFTTIVFTSISSMRAHHRRGGVIWPVVRAFSPGIVLGVSLGALLAAGLKSAYLQIFFVCFLIYVAQNMIRGGGKPEAARPLPGALPLFGVGGGIGLVSSLVGIGGGTMTVPFLSWCSVPLRQAVGTSAAVGLPIALTGAVTYMLNGWSAPGLPEYSLGYIYLPAVLGIAAASMCTAPLGTALSHRLPVATLRKIFAGFLILVGLRMIWQVLENLLA